ncbi:MAG TPA: MFS transporter [Candidatus Dormibacteraeota bacterium]|nr:MFS transporter [Candidatus Dormibacteraeota bacterium]
MDLTLAAPTATTGLWTPGHRALTVGLVLTVTLVAFEALAVATVMPLVERELGHLELYGWVFSAFFLGSLVGTVVVGGLLDRGSIVPPLAVGLGLFAIGLTIGGLAPSMAVLVGGRLLQGLGGGAIAPTAYVAIGRSFPEAVRPRMMFLLSCAWVVPGIAGPAVAGLLALAVTWRAVFLALLPIIALAAATTTRAMARVPAPPEETVAAASTVARLPAAIQVAAGAGLAMAGLTAGISPLAPVLLIAGGVLALPAIRRLSPAGTLRLARGLPAAVGLRGVLTFSFFMADAYLPLLLVDWRGATAAEAGIALTASTMSWTFGAWLQTRWVTARGVAPLVRGGFLVVALGVAATLLVLSPAVPWALAVATWAIAGLGMGLAYAPLSLAVLSDAPPESVGAASSALQLSDLLGTALGTGLGGAIIAVGAHAGLQPWVALAVAHVCGSGAAAFGGAMGGRLVAPPRAEAA